MQRCLRASHFFSGVTEASAGSDLTSERLLDCYRVVLNSAGDCLTMIIFVTLCFVQEAVVRMTNYHIHQGGGDIVMIQSDHTGAVDILSAELETADLLGEQRKGEA